MSNTVSASFGKPDGSTVDVTMNAQAITETPVQNVGAYGQEVSESIVSVRLLDRRDRRLLVEKLVKIAHRRRAKANGRKRQIRSVAGLEVTCFH